MSGNATLDLHDLTTYSPVRVFLSGLWRLIFGAVFAVVLYALLFALAKTAGQPHSAADPPRWLIALGPLIIGFMALLAMSSGMGRMVSAFAKNCFFRAGRDGISVRLPVRGWFGRFRVAEYWIKWSEVKQVVHFTYRVNGIPTSTSLRIRLLDGTRLSVERIYFSASVKWLQEQLLTIQASVGR
jgi:hypothetical protein